MGNTEPDYNNALLRNGEYGRDNNMGSNEIKKVRKGRRMIMSGQGDSVLRCNNNEIFIFQTIPPHSPHRPGITLRSNPYNTHLNPHLHPTKIKKTGISLDHTYQNSSKYHGDSKPLIGERSKLILSQQTQLNQPEMYEEDNAILDIDEMSESLELLQNLEAEEQEQQLIANFMTTLFTRQEEEQSVFLIDEALKNEEQFIQSAQKTPNSLCFGKLPQQHISVAINPTSKHRYQIFYLSFNHKGQYEKFSDTLLYRWKALKSEHHRIHSIRCMYIHKVSSICLSQSVHAYFMQKKIEDQGYLTLPQYISLKKVIQYKEIFKILSSIADIYSEYQKKRLRYELTLKPQNILIKLKKVTKQEQKRIPTASNYRNSSSLNYSSSYGDSWVKQEVRLDYNLESNGREDDKTEDYLRNNMEIGKILVLDTYIPDYITYRQQNQASSGDPYSIPLQQFEDIYKKHVYQLGQLVAPLLTSKKHHERFYSENKNFPHHPHHIVSNKTKILSNNDQLYEKELQKLIKDHMVCQKRKRKSKWDINIVDSKKSNRKRNSVGMDEEYEEDSSRFNWRQLSRALKELRQKYQHSVSQQILQIKYNIDNGHMYKNPNHADANKLKASLTNTLASPRLNDNHINKPLVYTTKSYAHGPQQQRKGILTSSNTNNAQIIIRPNQSINNSKSFVLPSKGISLNPKPNQPFNNAKPIKKTKSRPNLRIDTTAINEQHSRPIQQSKKGCKSARDYEAGESQKQCEEVLRQNSGFYRIIQRQKQNKQLKYGVKNDEKHNLDDEKKQRDAQRQNQLRYVVDLESEAVKDLEKIFLNKQLSDKSGGYNFQECLAPITTMMNTQKTSQMKSSEIMTPLNVLNVKNSNLKIMAEETQKTIQKQAQDNEEQKRKSEDFRGYGMVENPFPEYVPTGNLIDYCNLFAISKYWQKFQGSFCKGNKDGPGTIYLTNGHIFSGNFKDDLANGKGAVYVDGEMMLKGIWKDNILVTKF